MDKTTNNREKHNEIMAERSPEEKRVLLLAPMPRDAGLSAAILAEAGLVCTVCADPEALQRELEQGAGCLLLAESELLLEGVSRLRDSLMRQPAWSDLPVIVLTRGGAAESPQLLSMTQALGNVTLLEMPVRISTLLSSLHTALRARERQYQIRDQLTQQQRTEEALRESEARFRLAIAATRALVYDIELLANRLHIVEGLEELLGYRSGEVDPSQAWWFAQIHPEDGFTPEQAREIWSSQDAYHIEYRIRHKDGRYLDVVDMGRVLRDESGQPMRIVGSVTDITERKQAEEALRASEERLKKAISIDTVGVLFFRLDGHVWEANAAFERMSGYTSEDLRRMTHWEKLTMPEFLDVTTQTAKRLASRGETPPYEKEMIRKDGSRWWGLFAPTRLSGSGERSECVEFIIDITERKRAEQELERTRSMLTEGEKIAHLGTWQWFAETGKTIWSEEEFRLYGLEPAAQSPSYQELMARFFHPEDATTLDRVFSEAVRTRAIFENDHRIIRPDGELRFIHNRAHPQLGADGKLLAYVGVTLDITERKRAEDALHEANAQLRDADRRKDEFLAMLAHELRNPLAPIRNAAQVLRLTAPQEAILQRQRDIIDRQVTHMAHLLDDLLDVSRVTRGNVRLKQQPITLTEVLARAVEAANPLIESRRHALNVSPPSARLHVSGDYDRLIQIVGNLLSNAAKYTEEGGTIWLEAGREGDEAIIRVRDTGVGIAPEMLPKIFDVFTQAERTLDRSQGGLGLGLTLVKNLVQMHGGRVAAHSAGLGRGSEFVVCLPALPETQASGQPEAGAPAQAQTRAHRILVVDDVADTANSLAELLGLFGHEVRTVYEGASVLSIARQFRPDLILLDIGMPGQDGYHVARQIRGDAELKEVLLVALTGYGQEEDRRLARQAGFDHLFTKPVELDALQSLLR